jgi:hypothetical protein
MGKGFLYIVCFLWVASCMAQSDRAGKNVPARVLNDSLSEMTSVALREVSVSERKRISPLKELTVEPLAWETSTTHISSEDIKRMGAVTTLDALKYSTNGMPSIQGRRKKYYYLVRGQNMSSDYAINGVSLSTNGAGPMAQWIEAPSMLPANMIESIEVIRSGNSLLLGFSGLNGVINIKTRTFEKPETQVEAEYGTFNTFRAGFLHGSSIGAFHYAVSLYNDRTDGPTGRHSFENLWNLYAKVGYRYRHLLELDVENFYTYGTRFVTQAVDYQGLALPQRQLSEIWEYDPMRYNIFTVRLKINESATASTEFQLGYILNRMDLYPDAYSFSVDPVTGKAVVGDSIIRAHMLNEPDTVFNLGMFQAFQPFENNVLRAALLYASSANYTHGMSKKTICSATLLDQHRWGRADLHLGAKLIREYYNYYVPNQGFGDESRAIQNEWQPFLLNISTGASYRYNNSLTFNFVLNTGELPVDHAALQLLSDGSVETLKQERRMGLDIGLEYQDDNYGRLLFTLFMLNQKNTSEYTTRAYYDEDGLIRYYERNIDLSTAGAEMSWNSPMLWNNWSAFTNLSYKYARQSEASVHKKYTKQPPFIGNMGLSFSTKAFDFNVMGKYVSRYRTDRFLQKEVSIGNYFNWDVTWVCRFLPMPFQLYGSVVNLFDVRYCTVSPIYPDFGRQIRVGVRLSRNAASCSLCKRR